MNNRRKIFSFIFCMFVLFLTSCSSKIVYQIDGRAIPDHLLQVRILPLGIKLKYNIVNFTKIKEGNESYLDYEFLPVTTENIIKIENSERVLVSIDIFNPNKNEYSIVKHIKLEGGEEAEEVLYEGKLSRNSIAIELPLVEQKLIAFCFNVRDKNKNVVFKSFRTQYISIEG